MRTPPRKGRRLLARRAGSSRGSARSVRRPHLKGHIHHAIDSDMFGLGMGELLIILVIVLLVFGAGKLPQIGDALGRSIKNFKRAAAGNDEIEVSPKKREIGGDAKPPIGAETKHN